MSKTLFYRFFGLGKVPKSDRAIIEQEGIVLLEEGISGTVRFKNFRAPGKRYSYRVNWFSGSLVITEKHFLGFTTFRIVIGVPLDDPHMKDLYLSMLKDNVISIRFDASVFHEGWQGEIECRYTTPKAPLFYERLKDLCS